MIKKILLTSSILASFNFSFLAQAETPSKNFYVKLNTGYSEPKNLNKDFYGSKTHSSSIYGLALGYQFNQSFAADISFDYRAKYKNDFNSYLEDFDSDSTWQTNIKSQAIMANIYYNFAHWNNFTPYIAIGAGVSKNSTSNSNVLLHDFIPATSITLYGDNQIDLAYKVGCGIKYKIQEKFSISLQYQFVNLGKIKTSGIFAAPNGANHFDNSLIYKSQLKAQEVLIGLTYNF